MKILYISPFYPPDYAGGARLAHSVAVGLKNAEVMVLTKQFDVDKHLVTVQDEVEGIRVYRTRNRGRGLKNTLLNVLDLLRWQIKLRRSYEAIHFIGIPNEVFLMTIIGKLTGKKMMSTMELTGDDDLGTISRSRGGFLKIWSLRFHRYIGGLSEELLEESKDISSLKDRLIELPNAIEFDRYVPVDEPAKGKLQQKLLGKGYSQVLVFTGAISHRKGCDLILEFLQANKGSLLESDTLMVMVGPMEDHDLEAPFKELEASGVVKLTGSVAPEEVIPYYQMSDIFVFPSRREGFGRVALEARACGISALCSDIGPMRQINEDGVDALLFKSGNYVDFSEKLNLLIDNSELKQKLSSNARDSIDDKYKMRDLIDRHERVYKDL